MTMSSSTECRKILLLLSSLDDYVVTQWILLVDIYITRYP